MFFLDMEQDTMKTNGIPCPPSDMIFNIDQ
jgi:hypothetical protein